jgi:hypothetical protein
MDAHKHRTRRICMFMKIGVTRIVWYKCTETPEYLTASFTLCVNYVLMMEALGSYEKPAHFSRAACRP